MRSPPAARSASPTRPSTAGTPAISTRTISANRSNAVQRQESQSRNRQPGVNIVWDWGGGTCLLSLLLDCLGVLEEALLGSIRAALSASAPAARSSSQTSRAARRNRCGDAPSSSSPPSALLDPGRHDAAEARWLGEANQGQLPHFGEAIAVLEVTILHARGGRQAGQACAGRSPGAAYISA